MTLPRAFVLVAAMLALSWSAHGQALRQPELLARYLKLIAEFDRPGFEKFEQDYLAAAAPDGDSCLFGCKSGFSGNSPDIAGDGYREFLARADLVVLARQLYYSSNALGHLERSTALLQAYRVSYLAEESRAATEGGLNEDFYFRAWREYSGGTGQVIPPIVPAMALRSEVEQLKFRGTLSADDRQRLNSIEQALRKMTSENE